MTTAIIFFSVVVLLLICALFIQKAKIDSLNAKLEEAEEYKNRLLNEVEFLTKRKVKAEAELLAKTQEVNTLTSSIKQVSEKNEKLSSSLSEVTKAYQQASKTVDDIQVGILKLEFETDNKSKAVALNRTMLKAGSTIIREGNVLFSNLEGKEKGRIYILNAQNYENAKNPEI